MTLQEQIAELVQNKQRFEVKFTNNAYSLKLWMTSAFDGREITRWLYFREDGTQIYRAAPVAAI